MKGLPKVRDKKGNGDCYQVGYCYDDFFLVAKTQDQQGGIR